MNPSVSVTNGPSDLDPAELAERKRRAAVDYYARELGVLQTSLAKLEAKEAPASKVSNTRQMIADAQAALDAVKGA